MTEYTGFILEPQNTATYLLEDAISTFSGINQGNTATYLFEDAISTFSGINQGNTATYLIEDTISTFSGINVGLKGLCISASLSGYKLIDQAIFRNCFSYVPIHETTRDIIRDLATSNSGINANDRFGNPTGAIELTSGQSISWPKSETNGTVACWRNTGSGWVLDFDPEYISDEGITGFSGKIGEIYRFLSQIPQSQKTALEIVTRRRYGEIKNRGYSNLLSGCVAFWPLRYDAVDTVGGHNGTVSGGVGPSTGRFEEENGAFYFDGADDRISVNLYPDFPTSELTISFWLYPYELPLDELYDDAYIFAQYNGTFNLNRIEYYTNGYIRISNYYNNTWYAIASTNTCPILEWTFITITFDGTTTKIYLNGILDSEHTFAYWENSNNPYFFGERDSSTWRYNGKISEFAIFSECKPQSIVSALYNISKTKHITPTIDDNRR